MPRLKRTRRSSTGRPYGSLQATAIRAASSLSEELDDSWKEFFEDYRMQRNFNRNRRVLEHELGARWV